MIRYFLFSILVLTHNFTVGTSAQFQRQYNEFTYSARHSPDYYTNYYQPRQYAQNKFQDNLQLPPGVSLSEAKWICRNPKTGDMMIISSEENLTEKPGDNSQNYGQPQNISTHLPSNNNSPNLEKTDSINTNGEEVIDIRLGNN